MSKESNSRNVSFSEESQYFETVRSGNLENFKSFLQLNEKFKSQINLIRTYKGRLVFHLASHLNYLSILEYLVNDLNADINVYDEDNNNSLHLACMANKRSSHSAVIQFLISIGIKLDHLNDQMKLPIDLIKDQNILKMIEVKMQNLNMDPLKIKDCERIILREWVKQWRNTGKTNHWIIDEENKVTMLHFVAARRYFDILKEITKCPGVELNPIDIFGMTPMDILKEYHHQNDKTSNSDDCCILL